MLNLFASLLLICVTLKGVSAGAREGCERLTQAYPELTFSSATQEHAAHARHHWSETCHLSPECVFIPEQPDQIAEMINIIDITDSNFAVRSVGHSTSPGFAGTNSGILIALDKLNEITVSTDRTTVSLGPGQTWQRVYDALTPQGLSVVGGRLGPIGVGGLLIGGGLGFQSNEFGLACDSIVNMEVITGDGKIRSANATSNPELYWALKGGSNGFGIVTRFDVKTHELGMIWAGTVTYASTEVPRLLDEYSRYLETEPDPKSHFIFPIIDSPLVGGRIALLTFYYGAPLSAPPASFKPFLDVPHLMSSIKNQTIADFALELGQTSVGTVRALFRAVSFKPGVEMNSAALRIWEDSMAPLKEIDGFMFVYAMQPISKLMQTPRNGGNTLGFKPEDGIIQWIALTVRWNNKADDADVLAAMTQCTSKIEEEAEKQGKNVEQLYLNDASGDQPVYQSYGPENFKRLQAVQKSFNNHRIFHHLQNGHYNLDTLVATRESHTKGHEQAQSRLLREEL